MTDTDLFAKYDVPVPRYTSYPTVPQWHDIPTTEQWITSLRGALSAPDASLSLYAHLPFCESLCTFCGCNTVITRDHGRAQPYTKLLLAELDAYLSRVPELARVPASELHLGGGTPTFLSPEELADLVDGIFARLPRDPSGFHASVEADPRVTTRAHLDVLRDRGFSRLSLGVQDFNLETQQLVNRVQSPELVAALVKHARDSGYESVNFDLIYGLPGQTLKSMRELAGHVLDQAPDRLAVYSFARVPWIKPQQRKFRDDQIPEGADKRALYETIRARLLDAGYIELGLDHFAKPNDALARAADGKTMHRNFQGYTERRTTTLLGLGVSAISETPDCYHQNEKIITVYERHVSQGALATYRGHRLSAEDQRRRTFIRTLMTEFGLDLTEGQLATAQSKLTELERDGLIVVEHGRLTVPMHGRAFLRNIAAAFDAYMQAAPAEKPLYSRSV